MQIILKPMGAITVVAAFLLMMGVVLYAPVKAWMAARAPRAQEDMLIVSDAAKKGWLHDQIYRFNIENEGRLHVTEKVMDTRDALQAILNGKEEPVLWATSGGDWVPALGDAWVRSHPSAPPLVTPNDSATFRTFLRTPLVFLARADKVAALRHTLGAGGSAWGALHDAAGSASPLRFSYPDPRGSNCGFATLGMFLSDYARRANRAGDLQAAANDPAFVSYLRAMQPGFVASADQDDASALCAAFADGKLPADLVVVYESDALAVCTRHPELAVIYPAPTVVAGQSVAVIGGAGTTPAQRAGARAFLDFLSGDASVADGVREHFRPAQETAALSLAPQIRARQGQGFAETYTEMPVPPYAAVNDADFQWHTNIAKR